MTLDRRGGVPWSEATIHMFYGQGSGQRLFSHKKWDGHQSRNRKRGIPIVGFPLLDLIYTHMFVFVPIIPILLPCQQLYANFPERFCTCYRSEISQIFQLFSSSPIFIVCFSAMILAPSGSTLNSVRFKISNRCLEKAKMIPSAVIIPLDIQNHPEADRI